MTKRKIKLSDAEKNLSQFLEDLKNDKYIINKESLVVIARLFNSLVEANPQDSELKGTLTNLLRILESEAEDK